MNLISYLAAGGASVSILLFNIFFSVLGPIGLAISDLLFELLFGIGDALSISPPWYTLPLPALFVLSPAFYCLVSLGLASLWPRKHERQ